MSQNMNTQLDALCQELYEQEGLPAVRALAKQIPIWCKLHLEKELASKLVDKNRKALIKELCKNESFKQFKIAIANAEIAAKKPTTQTKQTKAWGMLFDKSRKGVEQKVKKAAIQLKALVSLKRKAVAKAIKDAEAEAKKAAAETKKAAAKAIKDAEAEAKKAAAETKKAAAKAIKDAETESKKAAAEAKKAAAEAAAEAKKAAAEAKKAAAEAAAEAKKAAAEAAAEAKKAAAEAAAEAKKVSKSKPTKADTRQIKRWSKIFTKWVKCGETETKKALTQLKKITKAKRAANAIRESVKKSAPKTKKKVVEEAAIGDDLIAALLAKASLDDVPDTKELVNEIVNDGNSTSSTDIDEDDEEEDIQVTRFEHNGVKYLKDEDGYLYDPKTQDQLGFWNGSDVEEVPDEE
jgi:histone H1/5